MAHLFTSRSNTASAISRFFSSRTRADSSGSDHAKNQDAMSQDAKKILASFILAALLGVVIVSVPLPRDAFSVAALWSLAFIAVGGLFGFLFGIPRVLQGDNPAPANAAIPNVPPFYNCFQHILASDHTQPRARHRLQTARKYQLGADLRLVDENIGWGRVDQVRRDLAFD